MGWILWWFLSWDLEQRLPRAPPLNFFLRPTSSPVQPPSYQTIYHLFRDENFYTKKENEFFF